MHACKSLNVYVYAFMCMFLSECTNICKCVQMREQISIQMLKFSHLHLCKIRVRMSVQMYVNVCK